MEIKAEKIKDIAGELECGMLCFYHISSGDVESYPDPDDPYFEEEPWKELIKKIKKNKSEYLQFEKMASSEAFKVMENFADSLQDEVMKRRIYDALSYRGPFQNFKRLIDDSDFRQDWFDFKTKAYIEHVKDQLEGFQSRQSKSI